MTVKQAKRSYLGLLPTEPAFFQSTAVIETCQPYLVPLFFPLRFQTASLSHGREEDPKARRWRGRRGKNPGDVRGQEKVFNLGTSALPTLPAAPGI